MDLVVKKDHAGASIWEAVRQHCLSVDTSLPVAIDARISMDLSRKIIRQVVAQQHDRPSLVADIAVEVGAEIIEGMRAPGADLNSVELARRFETSRTPIREALLLLETQGLITVPPRRRPRVATSDVDAVREVYHLRSRLLELAAAHIAKSVSPADLLELRHIVEVMDRAKENITAFMWGNVALHDYMMRIGGNRLAKKIVESLLLRTLPLRRLSLSQPNRLLRSLEDHKRLAKAFEEQDVALAIALVRSNHLSALRNVEDVLSEIELAHPK